MGILSTEEELVERVELAAQQVRRLRRGKIPQPAPKIGRGCPVEAIALPVSPMTEVTNILSAIEQGDPSAAEQLLPLVYEELRQLAAQKLAQEQPGQTLQATALVHEAYLRLVDVERAQHWNSRGHFFAAAAEAMRRILVDAARWKRRPKHGGGRQRVDLDELVSLSDDRAGELLSLHAALEKLEAESQEQAWLVKLRYFAGLSHQEAAQALGISRATADRYWAYAKAFLRCEMEDADNP
jgi:RNA polymerase sigma factor (TIGR02999 family)